MSLDMTTLLFCIATVQMAAAFLMLSIWHVMQQYPKEDRLSVLIWAGSQACCGIGTYFLAYRDVVTDVFSILAGNALLLTGLGLARVAVSAPWKGPGKWGLSLLPVAVWLGVCAAPSLAASPAFRILFMQAGIVCLTFWTASACFKSNTQHLHTVRWLGIVVLAEAIYHLTFAVYFHFSSLTAITDAKAHGIGQGYLFFLLATSAAKAVLVFAMVIEKQQFIYKDQANKDSLTGLANRRAFFDGSQRWFRDRKTTAKPFAVVMFDVDHFKQINDRLGHSTGDEILQLLGRICVEDLPINAIAARVGGEEFLIFLPDISPHKAMLRAERIRIRFAAEANQVVCTSLAITLSGGLYTSTADQSCLDTAVACADAYLYDAKHAGRNRIIGKGMLTRGSEDNLAPPALSEAA